MKTSEAISALQFMQDTYGDGELVLAVGANGEVIQYSDLHFATDISKETTHFIQTFSY